MMDVAELGLYVDSDGIVRADKSLSKFNRTAAGAEKQTGAVNREFKAMERLSQSIAPILATIVSIQSVRTLQQYSDAWTQVNNQLRQVTGSESQLIGIRQQLLDISRATNSDLDTTVSLYSEMYRATRDLDLSQRDVADITKTINNLFLAGGKAASETAGAVRQLTQALSAGALRGDEFNSVAEGAPRIMDALAVKLRMTRGELREFAATGGITAKILTEALADYSEEAQRMADLTERTFGMSMVNARTNVIEFVGGLDTANSAIARAGQAIETLTENLDSVLKVGQLLVVLIGSRMVGALGASAAASVKMTAASVAEARATASKTAEEIRFLKVVQGSLAAQLANNRATAAAAGLRAQLAANTAALTAAQNTYTAALARSTVATGATAAATGALRGALALIGGPLGAVTLAAIAFAKFVQYTGETARIERAREEIKKLTRGFGDLTEAQQENRRLSIQNQIREVTAEIEALRIKAQQAAVGANAMANSWGGAAARAVGYTFAADARVAEERLEALQAALKSITTEVEGAASGSDGLNMSIGLDPSVVKLYQDAMAEVNKTAATFKGIMDSLEKDRIALEEGEAAAYKFELRLQGLGDAHIKAAMAAREYNDAVGAAKSQEENFKRIMDGLKEERILLEEGEDAAYAFSLSLENLTDKQREAIIAARDYNKAIKDQDGLKRALEEIKRAAGPAYAAMADFDSQLKTLQDSLAQGLIDPSKFDDLVSHIERVRDAALKAAEGLSFWGKVEAGTNAVIDGLGQVQSTMADGSKEAQKLGQVMQALQVVQGIAAILNQGMGDPYTAIGRMAAMAAAVASLIGSVGFAGEGSTAAADAQAAQGTGTVLGDSAAKSESAIKSLEMQVSLTQDLVGINRGMLAALQAMQAGISGASNLITRGTDFSGSSEQWGLWGGQASGLLGKSFDFVTSLDGLTGWLDKALGGSRSVINSGIEIAGGYITDLVNNTVAEAFQVVESRKHAFASKKVRRHSEALGSSVTDQFELVFGSMVDAVTAAAEVLGVADATIQRRISQFRVAATEISLKDLSGEDQQAELNAVFSAIFDDLAASVVPFASQFQEAGEGMAETLIRVASQVQAAQEAVGQLGLSIFDGLEPEKVAQVADELTNAAGGLEAFVSSLQSFVSKFASEEQQLAIATDQVTRAFVQLEQDLPATRDGLWSLMQTLTDPNDIAAVLSLADALDEYYSALEEIDNERQSLTIELLKALGREEEALAMQRQIALAGLHESNRALQEQVWALNDAAQAQQALAEFQRGIADQILDSVSPAHAELERLNRAMAAQIAQAQELGIAEDDLTNMRRLHQLQLMKFAAGLDESIKSLSDQLFGGEVESQVQHTVRAVDNGMNQIRKSMINAIEGVQNWLLSSQLSAVSPLTPSERLGEAERQFNTQFAAAMGGDVDAISALPKLADQFLSEASTFFGGSTAEFDQIWMQVRDAMQQVTGIDVPDQQPDRAQQTAIKQATESTALSALEQIGIAADILSQVAAYSRITEESPAEIARRLDVPLGDLIGILGETPERTAGALDHQFNELVTGFDMTIDPLLSVQHAQLEATQKQTEDQNARLERIEKLLERSVQYDAVTANNTAHTAVSQEQLAAEARKNRNMGSPQQRIQ